MSTPLRELILYKRNHVASCLIHSLDVADPQQWFRCTDTCLIWIYGRLPSGDKLPRQTTGETDIVKALEVKRKFLSNSAAEASHGRLIQDCIKLYMKDRESELGDKAKDDYLRMFARLTKHCADVNVYHMGGLTADLLASFKASLKMEVPKPIIDKLRQFLKIAYEKSWTDHALHLKIRANKTEQVMKSPYEEDEVMRILAGVLELRLTHFAKFPKTTRLLVELMLETGMRVGDACLFDPRVAKKGDHLWVHQFEPQKQQKVKAKKSVDVFLSESLWQAIMRAKADGEWYGKDLPFAFPHDKDEYYYAHVAYEMMQYVGEASGVEDCRPHRLRDTCAVALLEGSNRACTRSGPLAPVPLEYVSKLLGHHSVTVTERYYGKWTPGRSRLVEAAIARTVTKPLGQESFSGYSGNA